MARHPSEAPTREDEPFVIITNRFLEARAAGLTRAEARKFAEADPPVDVGLLRKLVKLGCDPRTIAKIVT